MKLKCETHKSRVFFNELTGNVRHRKDRSLCETKRVEIGKLSMRIVSLWNIDANRGEFRIEPVRREF